LTVDNHLWWQKGIIYQIYPRSFQDSNGDGVGDLPGIISRLDYVQSLGVDAVWISPIYPSPMADFGYDVSDYRGIHPLFGTMADFDHLLAEAHRRGLRIILDLVPNHTSNQHPWFLESRSSRDNPRRDWYIWRDPAPNGGPPNNWLSHFGGPAWTYDERTGQYYMHQFLKEQPELNYRNPEVLQAMLDVMRFWLDKGVDGFRVDVIHLMAKDEQFRDEPPNPDYQSDEPGTHSLQHIYTQDVPRVHDYIRAMRRVLDAYDERMMVGEIYLPYERLVTYYGGNLSGSSPSGRSLDECHLPFNFNLIHTPWEAQVIRQTVEAYEAALPEGAWPNWVLGNHDRSRVGSRAGRAQIRVANMLLLTLRGTPTCYYGDEIGMVDVDIPREKMRDPAGLNQPDVPGVCRDPERTPMQWDASANAGFCPPGVEPWLPIADDYRQVNVAAQDHDPRSTLTLFRRLTALRRETPALSVGSYRSVETGTIPVFAYERQHEGTRMLVILNFSGTPQSVDLSAVAGQGQVILSTGLDREGVERLTPLQLRANEGVILRL
jgi:alpha-glucosidase